MKRLRDNLASLVSFLSKKVGGVLLWFLCHFVSVCFLSRRTFTVCCVDISYLVCHVASFKYVSKDRRAAVKGIEGN